MIETIPPMHLKFALFVEKVILPHGCIEVFTFVPLVSELWSIWQSQGVHVKEFGAPQINKTLLQQVTNSTCVHRRPSTRPQ